MHRCSSHRRDPSCRRAAAGPMRFRATAQPAPARGITPPDREMARASKGGARQENGRESPRPASVDYVALREDIDEVSNALESFNTKLRRLMIGEQERAPEATEGEDANREGADSSTDIQADEAGTTQDESSPDAASPEQDR